MDANEIIGKLIAEPKYRFADKALIAEVVIDIMKGYSVVKICCATCENNQHIYFRDEPCISCDVNCSNFERAK